MKNPQQKLALVVIAWAFSMIAASAITAQLILSIIGGRWCGLLIGPAVVFALGFLNKTFPLPYGKP